MKIKENGELSQKYRNNPDAKYVYVPAQNTYCYIVKEWSGSPGGGVYPVITSYCLDKFPQYLSDLIDQFNMLMRYNAEINKRNYANATFSRMINYTQEKIDKIVESESYPTPELVEEVTNLNIQIESLQYQQIVNERWLGASIYHKENVIEPRISKKVENIREYIRDKIWSLIKIRIA